MKMKMAAIDNNTIVYQIKQKTYPCMRLSTGSRCAIGYVGVKHDDANDNLNSDTIFI